jgi:four helix bundle protein
MNKTNSYKDLTVYQKAYKLAIEVYKVTKEFPGDEKYGLGSQLKRCSVSIPSNIAEGYRRGRKEYIQFLKIAFGSCAEMETQISLSFDLGYVRELQYSLIYELNEEVSKIIGAMIRSMEAPR